VSTPALLHTKADLAAARPGLPAPVVLVPTMGALHAGHRALLRAARAAAGPSGSVIVSIFVNPLQFRPGEDLDRYPRTLDDDLAMCAQEGARAVFAPSAAEMYPGGPPQVTVDPGPAGQVFEGEFRPGFFGGVLTVVLKLFHLIRPDVAVFGEKDAQQLALVRRLVADTDLGVAIEAVPTVRDPDGLATSSRNRYLSAADRELALTLPRALRAGQARAASDAHGAASDAHGAAGDAHGAAGDAHGAAGDAHGAAGDAHGAAGDAHRAAGDAHRAAAVLAAAREVLRGAPALAVDYVAVVDPRTFGPAGPGPALIVAAVTAGGTRLIDNVPVVLSWGQNTERDFRGAADH
jgi:pantoate--beta-alanine ligase